MPRNINRHTSNTKIYENAGNVNTTQNENAPNPVRIRMIRQKRATCPVSLNLDENHQILAKKTDPIFEGSNEWVTPTKKDELNQIDNENEEDELIANEESDADKQSDESIKQSSSDEDTEEDDEAIQAQLQKDKEEEVRKMHEYAKANGFDITIDEKKEEPRKRFIVTKEMLDEQQKKDRERMIKEMYVPPPLEILRRKYTNKEPIRTGFNQGLLPISIKNNVELKRAP